MSETDQPDLSQLQAQAEDAKQILASPVFNAAFAQTNNQILNAFMKSPPEAKELREHLYAKYSYGQQFVHNIDAVIKAYKSRSVTEEQKAQQQGATTGAEEGGD